jgi:parallel beta-helix repeat protein
VITKPGIKLVGLSNSQKGGVILQNPGTEENGIKVEKGADGFSVENLTVQNFTENGIFLTGVNGFRISHVRAVNNGEYGIFPVLSSHGIIQFCTASGHADTGIYVGQSSDVVIQFNEVFDNVNGIESENAHNILITLNNAHENSLGIFADLLPGKTVTTSSNIKIIANIVKNNNHPNFSNPNDLAAAVPSGVGILVLGADQALVERNLVSGNNFTGITVFSTLVLGALAGLPPEAFAGIDPNPDGAIVRRNILTNNGRLPPVLPIPVPGVDLLWDGSGNNNCWSNNIFKTSYPSPLPSCN